MLLGKVTFLASDCITPNGTSFTFSEGKFMITTLTGELLFANYSGQFVPTGEGTKFVFSNASFQITGGTGRYFKATAAATLTRRGRHDDGAGHDPAQGPDPVEIIA
jgi:hypothetical protein